MINQPVGYPVWNPQVAWRKDLPGPRILQPLQPALVAQRCLGEDETALGQAATKAQGHGQGDGPGVLCGGQVVFLIPGELGLVKIVVVYDTNYEHSSHRGLYTKKVREHV